jgi:hypothetical protein
MYACDLESNVLTYPMFSNICKHLNKDHGGLRTTSFEQVCSREIREVKRFMLARNEVREYYLVLATAF